MKIDLYINAASCISPQPTFNTERLPDSFITGDAPYLKAIEPDYKQYLNIPAARRMSRLIKMGVTSALHCLNQAGVKIPDAIIVGTGLGCMEDSEKFLASLIANNEQTLSPTSFIFSTHNTVAAQIALILQCNNYNFTHTHRGLSFELTISDAALFLGDHPDAVVLAGASDEVTPTSYRILERLGALEYSVAGEGSAFFLLSRSRREKSYARISAVSTLNFPEGDSILNWILAFREENQVSPDAVWLTGLNKDSHITETINRETDVQAIPYKHLCGEYHTSTAFAVWAGASMLSSQHIPAYLYAITPKPFNQLLILNHYKGRSYSLILLEKC